MAYRFRGGGHFTAGQTRSSKSFVHSGRRVTIKGENFELNWNGPVLQQLIQQALVSAFEKLSDDALAYMQSLTPVRTGNLQESCVVEVNVVAGRLTIQIGNTAFYAIYIELGTFKMAAQPFIRPTFDYLIKKLPTVIRNEVRSRGLKS